MEYRAIFRTYQASKRVVSRVSGSAGLGFGVFPFAAWSCQPACSMPATGSPPKPHTLSTPSR